MVIYCTTNLLTFEKYIGRDKYNNPNYLGSGTHFSRAVKKYGKENFKKQILQNEFKNEEDLDEAEIYWIAYFGAQKSDLFYNIKPGGRGHNVVQNKIAWNKGKKNYITDEHRKNLQKQAKLKAINRALSTCSYCHFSHLNKGMMNRLHFDRCKENPNRDMSINYNHKEETKRKIGLANSISLKGKISCRRKAVIQLDLEGNFIAEFPFITNAILITKIKGIANCVEGYAKTAGSNKWMYLEDYQQQFKQAV